MRFQFGVFSFDTESRELARGTSPVPLSPRAFTLLRLLLEERPRAFSKSDLQDRLWPATYVSETNLANLVAEIRRATGDDARHPRWIRTVHAFGYAFCGPAGDDLTAPPRNAAPVFRLVIDGAREMIFPAGEIVIGRDPRADVFLDSPTLSRRHARIVFSASDATVEDLDSKNGTSLRGRPLKGRAPVEDDDEIRVGAIRITFHRIRAEKSTETDISHAPAGRVGRR
ncbi:MAG: FHA domain-containing protein [Thermoanaerobaculia bacterium]